MLFLKESHSLPEAIERETFSQHRRLASIGYRRSMRTLVFALKYKSHVRDQVMKQEMQIADFVKMFKKEGKKS